MTDTHKWLGRGWSHGTVRATETPRRGSKAVRAAAHEWASRHAQGGVYGADFITGFIAGAAWQAGEVGRG